MSVFCRKQEGFLPENLPLTISSDPTVVFMNFLCMHFGMQHLPYVFLWWSKLNSFGIQASNYGPWEVLSDYVWVWIDCFDGAFALDFFITVMCPVTEPDLFDHSSLLRRGEKLEFFEGSFSDFSQDYTASRGLNGCMLQENSSGDVSSWYYIVLFSWSIRVFLLFLCFSLTPICAIYQMSQDVRRNCNFFFPFCIKSM